MKAFSLAVYKCPHGHLILSLDDNTGHGVRLNDNKCCNNYSATTKWSMSKSSLGEAVIAFENAIEELQE